MANETPDYINVSRKRIKLDFDDPDGNSNSDSVLNSSDCIPNVEEKTLIGDEQTSYDSGDGNSLAENSGSEDENDLDETASTNDADSDSSSQSDASEKSWTPSGSCPAVSWLERQMMKGVSPRTLINKLSGENSEIPSSISDMAIWKVLFQCITSEPVRRKRLPHVYSFNHAVNLIRGASKILVVTGAGVSVSCGIPDFRSKDGIYGRLAVDFPNLPDPQAMFDINFFKQDPRPFFKFAREIYPGQFQPSPSHRFIKMLERRKKLLRNYAQNIDTLERIAGINNVIECHGSFATATCTVCNYKVPSEEIKEAIFNQVIPYCTKCPPEITDESQRGIMKPDIVFFGEGLPDAFHVMASKDKKDCDLLIVIGSSMKVKPVALIPSYVPSHIPQILINRESLPMLNFDVELLGDADVIVDEICKRLGGDWEEVCWRETPLNYVKRVNGGRKYKKSSSGSSASSSSSSSENEKESTTSVTDVRCQKIGKRKIGTDDDSSRHISLDSSRDSGIGENSSNSSDSNILASAASSVPEPKDDGPGLTAAPTTVTSTPPSEITTDEPSACVRPAVRLTKEEKLNCFYRLSRRKFVFPGAEIPGLCDSDEETQ